MMRSGLMGAMALSVMLSGAAAQSPSVTTLDPGFKVDSLRSEAGRAIAVGGKEAATIESTPRGAAAKPVKLTSARFQLRDMIPHAIVTGSVRIAIAYLAGPTGRYAHGALGDAIEAEKLILRDTAGMTAVIEAGEGAVFEDLQPRIVDLDGDGFPEVVVVKSYIDRGAALAIVARKDNRWSIVAETPPIGQPKRWLNPAAFADFDGDGKIDIALVRSPHLDGVLEIWGWREGRLDKLGEQAGFSNHAHGSTVLALAATADFDRDGTADLAIPSLDRTSLRYVSFKGGRFSDLGQVRLPAPALSGLVTIGEGDALRIIVGLQTGKLAVVLPPRGTPVRAGARR